MDITNHKYSKMRPPECMLSYENPASPDILIQTKKTVVYLDVFKPGSSLVDAPAYSDDESDSNSCDIESGEEEDPLMVKPLPARGIPPAKPTILSKNYIEQYLNTKYYKHNNILELRDFESSGNNKTETISNKKLNVKSDPSPCSITIKPVETQFTSNVAIIKNNMNEMINSKDSCEKIIQGTNLPHKINIEIPIENYESVSMNTSPCHSPQLDESFTPGMQRKGLETMPCEKKVNIEKRDKVQMTREKKDYKCNRPDCDFVSATRKVLHCHKREKHRNNRDFLCTVCPFRTSFASDLKKHLGTHVPVVMKCPYKDCDYVGKHSNSLDYHKRKVHPTGSPLHCLITSCQYTTFLPSNLKVHQIKNHGSGKTISCDQCSYRCYLVAELRKHQRTHSSETPYACDFPNCHYACKISSNLRKHKRIHTEERPYACDVCSFRSNFISSLKAHKRIHTDERPYCCEQCGYRCNSASNLKKHIVQRHPGTVYEIKKDNGVLKNGRKKINHAPKITTTQIAENLSQLTDQSNMRMKATATNILAKDRANLTPMLYSMPMPKLEQEWLDYHGLEYKKIKS